MWYPYTPIVAPVFHAFLIMHIYKCAGEDSNLRRPKSRGLQPRAIDHSATDAFVHYTRFRVLFQNQKKHLAAAFADESIAVIEAPLPYLIVQIGDNGTAERDTS